MWYLCHHHEAEQTVYKQDNHPSSYLLRLLFQAQLLWVLLPGSRLGAQERFGS